MTQQMEGAGMTQDWVIEGGRALMPGGFETADIAISDGRITDAARNARRFSGAGCLVLPGIVDMHGDGFERILHPRPNVSFPLPLALAEADRQLIVNGITTAFHGLSVSWEPGLRSVGAARSFLTELDALSGRLDCDTHVNLRWETYCLDDLDEIESWLTRHPSLLLSVNDHLTAEKGLGADSVKIGRMADRSGLSREACVGLIHRLLERSDEVPGAIRRMTGAARQAGRMVFAHDETSPEQRRDNRDLGISVSEFPMTLATASEASAAGEAVVLGAPNVVRGGSQNNAVNAEDAIAAGLCSALASDYYYPAPMAAAFALADRGTLPLDQAWRLISTRPARAAGLADRGEIAPGQRADLIVLDPDRRYIRAVFSAGRKVLERE
ncbi:alpha-D-ribose 1-methylphosphonate 5-triphosphate diphosphatase [Paracoccus sp. SCSIO 75233]|uniref:alpha-D-ribose 1-methylphosphonate 5-triphosphate diphosphatase n=1 Tax=Paracoccus sp. SCSIO 75233 TaxID=3017782 RepID=UPI0022F13977|nr:alpha-D-ribose 1-methylphosphonate 5-triphosphate diphosphatase [Paracoccus sp. SCSIO 75233]WBU54639.1 alpha-D-ribose 1-methylphosphonate 5-triphosphate diphosphatase [Paracoccus sp. SCSIO 75233]